MKSVIIQTHKELNEIMFPVKKVRAADLFGKYSFPHNKDWAITDGESNVLNICSEKYKLIKNEDLILPIFNKMQEVFGEGKVKTIVKSYGGSRFFVDLIPQGKVYKVRGEDTIKPMISVKNSYDGGVAQSIALSFHRQICLNGMMGFSSEFREKKKHTSFLGKVDVDKIVRLLEGVEDKIERFKKMTDRRLTRKELDELLKKIEESEEVNYPKREMKKVVPTIMSEASMMNLKEIDLWLVYNGLNNAVYHSDSKMQPHKRAEIDTRVINFLTKGFKLN